MWGPKPVRCHKGSLWKMVHLLYLWICFKKWQRVRYMNPKIVETQKHLQFDYESLRVASCFLSTPGSLPHSPRWTWQLRNLGRCLNAFLHWQVSMVIWARLENACRHTTKTKMGKQRWERTENTEHVQNTLSHQWLFAHVQKHVQGLVLRSVQSRMMSWSDVISFGVIKHG